ncbi:hypothetical protein [Streptomyces swartbergensis]|uniref:hypothetical protein n=1 Tax=Streptomyces swartbergensis TaxID=487165 RepID=UPI0037F13E25
MEESRARGCGDDLVALPVTLFLLPHPAGLLRAGVLKPCGDSARFHDVVTGPWLVFALERLGTARQDALERHGQAFLAGSPDRDPDGSRSRTRRTA